MDDLDRAIVKLDKLSKGPKLGKTQRNKNLMKDKAYKKYEAQMRFNIGKKGEDW
jgi:hypothetical protein